MVVKMPQGGIGVLWLQHRDALASTCLVYNEQGFSIEVGVLGCHSSLLNISAVQEDRPST